MELTDLCIHRIADAPRYVRLESSGRTMHRMSFIGLGRFAVFVNKPTVTGDMNRFDPIDGSFTVAKGLEHTNHPMAVEGDHLQEARGRKLRGR